MSRRKQHKREMSTLPALSDDVHAMFDELQGQSDRGMVLIAAAYLEEILGVMLGAHLVDVDVDRDLRKSLLTDPGSPFGTFSSRIKGTYALGLIGPDMRHNLDVIRDVRNLFAHHYRKLEFASPDVNDHFKSMRPDIPILPVNDPRYVTGEWFTVSFALLASRLMLRAHEIKRVEKAKDYPTGVEFLFGDRESRGG